MHTNKYLHRLTIVTLASCLVALKGPTLVNNDAAKASPAPPVTSALLPAVPDTTNPNFVHAAQIATQAVVHIKAKQDAKVVQMPEGAHPLERLFREFFGSEFDLGPREYKSQPKQSAGSGVIMSKDGYIITNNHVIDGADKVDITLNDNRQYTARIIGQDRATDLALLKIKEKNLPYLVFGNSDEALIGDWVLAVGNPFNLISTVTQGIISAKARAINLPKSNEKIKLDTFIQTSAAVNPGNSGGALVNLKGELIGINTAISTPTGAFAGYSFAIPSSIVEKVVADLKKYGTVQRAILGIIIRNMNAELAKEKQLTQVSGVYIVDVHKQSAAAAAGLKSGDIVTAINGRKVKNTSQLQEQIALYKPNEKIRVTYLRKNKERTVTVTLKLLSEPVKIVANQSAIEVAGATLENVSKATQERLKITGGVRVKALKKGAWQEKGVREGFIITAINHTKITDIQQLTRVLKQCQEESILVEGIYPDTKKKDRYGLPWDSTQ
ncbi:MAG: Do family serine endopeptidase [Bacteroidota bacterium]